MFTEQGIAMLSGVLRSDVAVQVSIRIMNTFVEMRRFIANNALFKYQWKSENVDVPLMKERRTGHVSLMTKEDWESERKSKESR